MKQINPDTLRTDFFRINFNIISHLCLDLAHGLFFGFPH
jgi:hypothetical protein